MFRRLAVATLATFLLGYSCGHHSSAPWIRNALDRAVTVRVEFRNGSSYVWGLEPGETATSDLDFVALDGIQVRLDGKEMFEFRRSELEAIQANLPQDAAVLWEIGEDGIRAIAAPHPAAPERLLSPPGERLVEDVRELKFVWSPVDAAVRYHLELADDPGFNHLLVDGWTDQNEVRCLELGLRELLDGTYFWRVASINGEGYYSHWSIAARFDFEKANSSNSQP